MTDREKIIEAWERCKECKMYPAGMSQAYQDCEYTIGLYCGQDKLVWRTLDMLKQLPNVVRCRDCKYWPLQKDGRYEVPSFWTPCTDERCEGEWYCANGERKSD